MNDKVHHRQLSIDSTRADDKKRIVDASISSTKPYERYFGYEVLSHDQSAINFERANDGLALLLDHDSTKQIGRVENIRIDGDRLRCSLRFSNSNQASEIWDDVKNGIRTDLSVGYQVIDMVETGQRDDKPEFTVTKWMPIEASIVAIPADQSVGIGREHSTLSLKGNIKMAHEKIDEAVENEKSRVREIIAYGEMYPQLVSDANDAVKSNTSVERFRKYALKQINNAQPIEGLRNLDQFGEEVSSIGLSTREAAKYSFQNAIMAQVDHNYQRQAGFELEVSRAMEQKNGKKAQGLWIPQEVLSRDLSVGVTTAGGNGLRGRWIGNKGLIYTDHMGGNFIDMLRNRTLIKTLGAQVLAGLTGDVQIPKQTGAGTAYWVDEGVNLTEGQQTLGQVALSPKTMGAFTDFTRKLMLQSSPDIENMVRSDLATVLALELDRVAINGSGTGDEPTGILNTTGIGAVALGANGLAPTWGSIVDLEAEIANSNADVGALAYLTNSAVRKKLKQTTKVSGDAGAGFIWGDGNEPGFGSLNGYRSGVSGNVPSNLTKGSGTALSAILFGNFHDLLIGEWSGIDLQVDPYTLGVSGGIRVTVFQDIDIAVRHAESFAAITDAVTV